MEQLVLQLPEDLAQRLRRQSHNALDILALGLQQEERIEFALQEYCENRASIGHAAYLAGLTVQEMIEHAVLHGVEPHWDEKMISQELGQ